MNDSKYKLEWYVLGVDSFKPMIDAANEVKQPNEEYKIADVQNLE